MIAAHSAEGVEKAVNYFREQIIPTITQDEAGDFVIDFPDKREQASYRVDALTLDGNSIGDYTIVYGKDNRSGEMSAAAVAEVIANETGYVLPIASDEMVETACEILVGRTNRALSADNDALASLHYDISLQSGKLVIGCRGYLSADAAIRQFFTEKMKDGGTVALRTGKLCNGRATDEAPFPLTEGSDIRIISYNLLADSLAGRLEYRPLNILPTSERAELFGGVLELYQPDFVGIQEADEAWVECLPEHLGRYALVCTKTDDGLHSTTSIVYDAEKYDVLAHGGKHYTIPSFGPISWAVFSNKTTGAKLAMISTHWLVIGKTGDSEDQKKEAGELAVKIAELKEKYDCPVFITGDFNTNNRSENHAYFMSLIDMTNVIANAEHCYDAKVGTYTFNAKKETSVDWVMVTHGDGIFKGYGKLHFWNYSRLSDHRAILADVDLLP